ncbi:MAG: hypothetical protein SEPTF4163_004433, partial [Sporothrix epigloea]
MDATANPDDSIDSTTILLQKLLSFEVERQQREKEREEREREREDRLLTAIRALVSAPKLTDQAPPVIAPGSSPTVKPAETAEHTQPPAATAKTDIENAADTQPPVAEHLVWQAPRP